MEPNIPPSCVAMSQHDSESEVEYIETFVEDLEEEEDNDERHPSEDIEIELNQIREMLTDDNKARWRAENLSNYAFEFYSKLLKINNWRESDEGQLYDILEWFTGYSSNLMYCVDSIMERSETITPEQKEWLMRFTERSRR